MSRAVELFAETGKSYPGLGNLASRETVWWNPLGRYKDGSVFSGEWRDGRRCGHGVFRWPSGDVYDGQWRDHRRNGRGTYRWPDGRRYEGGYRDDQRSGEGPSGCNHYRVPLFDRFHS